MNYKDLYQSLIVNQAKLLIVEHSEKKGKEYSYNFRHHILSEDITLKICSLLIDNIVFYSYSSFEIEQQGLVEGDLRESAAYALSERLAKRQNPDSDGFVGELMLDILIQVCNSEAQKLITRAKYTMFLDNREITGYDAAFFVKNKEKEIELWLGQSKAGALNYCKTGICNDLNNKFLDNYFCHAVRYMKDRAFDETTDEDLLNILNHINYVIKESYKENLENQHRKKYVEDGIFQILNDFKVTVVVPCLLMFDSDIYDNEEIFRSKLTESIDDIFNYFEKKKFAYTNRIKIKVIFIILPIKKLNDIKTAMVKFKKEVQ